MDEASYIPLFGGGLPRSSGRQANAIVYFNRPELTKILNVYGRMVAAGEWRDYAIDHLRDEAMFSIFRRASEMPLYRIIKEPTLAKQQGMWRIMGMDGQILKRGKDLSQLLKYFDRQLVRVVD
ncbi:DUF2794 domain-containing protein [Kordiimonas aestuarii]|uniref:DUF2794 domain-containing protein n=1 Tax=Kordiimonas aestuarii TaxID=1005925 RepID=UPI0021D29068|nr:DUF2794 domain-containing protein [Kordiimonas aestuarii]